MKRFKIISSLALCITLISCSSSFSVSNNLDKNTILNTNNQKIVKTFDIDAGKTTNTKTNNNVKVKLKFPSGFNTKYVNRKTTKDIQSVLIWLTTSNTTPTTNTISGTYFAFDINPNSERNYELEYEFNFKNISTPNNSTPIYAAAKAYSLPQADVGWSASNITNSTTETSAVSTSYVTMDANYALAFTPASSTSLDVNIKLLDAQKSTPSTPEQIYDVASTIGNRSWDMSVDNAGNGLVVWKEDTGSTRKIKYAKITDFLPPNVNTVLNPDAIEPNEYTVPATITLLNKVSVSVNNKGNGFIFYSGYDSSSSSNQIFAIPVYNYVLKLSSEMNLTNFYLGETISEIDSEILQNGDGLVVFTSNYLFGGINKNIFGIKVTNDGKNTPTNSNPNAFYVNANEKNNPKISINELGNGVLTWDEQFDGSNYDIFAMALKDLDVPEITNVGETIGGNSGFSNLTGTNTFFKTTLTKGSRIFEGINTYVITNVTTNVNATITPNFFSTFSVVTLKGKAIAKTLSGTINVTSGQNTASGLGGTTLFLSELKVGERVKIFDPLAGTPEELVVSAIGSDSSVTFLRAPSTTCNPCKISKKSDFMLTNDVPNNINGRYPNVQVNSEMKSFIVWKEDTTTHSVQGVIFDPLSSTPVGTVQMVGDATGLNTTSILNGEDDSPPALGINKGSGEVVWTMKDASGQRNIYRRDIANYVPYISGVSMIVTTNTTQPYTFPLIKFQVEPPTSTPPFKANATYLFFKRGTGAPNKEYIELLNKVSLP